MAEPKKPSTPAPRRTAAGGRRRTSVTLRDVAQAAGVHPSTVSRVLLPDTRSLVHDETAARVEAAIRDLGYRPNPLARSLKTDRTMTVGVIIPDLTNPLFPPIVCGVEERLIRSGYSALIANTLLHAERERQAFDVLAARRVDGFIMATARREDPVIEDALADGVPLVLVVRTIDGGRATAVITDDRLGMRLAVEHLVSLGHRRIAHLAGPQDTSTGLIRHAAFLDAVRATGLDADLELVVYGDAFTEAEGERAARELLSRGVPFTAVVAANDLMALGLYTILTGHGLRCPTDVSVVGVNDVPLADRLSPPLTTLAISPAEIGARAAGLLLERIADPSLEPVEVKLEPTLVVRGSTARPVKRRPRRAAA
jgi:LacI family transcriptional regulator, galactose operon repressor